MQRIPMTAQGHEALENELKHLKAVARPEVIQAIAEAREHGDLSENAEYHAAKESQSHIEGRILELEDKIGRAQVIDTSKLTGDTIRFGATVTVADEDNGQEATYKIVGEDEASIADGKLSISSPLARAMIGKGVDDVAEVSAPGGAKSYEIISVKWI